MKHVKKLLAVLLTFSMFITLSAFSDADKVYADNASDFVINVDHVLVKYNGAGGDITIPSGVTEIGRKAFAGCTTISSVKIPEKVTTIGESAFDSCNKLVSVKLPSTLTTIGNNAFFGCTSLNDIVIPESVNELGICAFCHCDQLTDMYVPQSVKTIGNYAMGYLFVNGKYSPVENFCIMGVKGSQAEKFAEENANITFLTKEDLTAKVINVTNSKKGKAKVTWYRNPNTSGYEIQYATNKKFSKAKTVTVSADNGSKTISSMKKGKTYYFRVRGYRTVAGTKYYSDWSSSKSIKIKK